MYILTEAMGKLKGNANNYIKLRAGYGTSANFPNPYLTSPILVAVPNASILLLEIWYQPTFKIHFYQS